MTESSRSSEHNPQHIAQTQETTADHSGPLQSRLLKNRVWLGVLGALLLIFGLIILFNPFESIIVAVLFAGITLIIDGILKLRGPTIAQSRFFTLTIGTLLIIAGVVVPILMSFSIELMVLAVGIALIISGVADLVSAIRKHNISERILPVITGVTSVLFGILTLSWQDVALLVIAIAFSAKLIVEGIKLIAKATTQERNAHGKRFTWLKPAASYVGACILLFAAVSLLVVGYQLKNSVSHPDAFYSYSGEIPSTPGTLIASEPFVQGMPDGVRGWRILYSTTRDEVAEPVLASAFVMAPPATGNAPQPVIAWTHGTTGYATGCAPTVLPDPFPLDQSVPAVDKVVENGWVMVGTDYPGMGTTGSSPYLIGVDEGRAALDSVRAAKQLSELHLANETVVWGHSQGGGAALWTASLADSYAPDVNVIGAVAAAPASDLIGLLKTSEDSPGGKVVGAYALKAYSEKYSDVSYNEYVKPETNLILQETAKRCLTDKSFLVSGIIAKIIPGSIFEKDPTTGALGNRLQQNIPTGAIKVPILIAQGESDGLVRPDVQEKYVNERCKAGQTLEYRTYSGKDHVSLVHEHPELDDYLEQWTKDRLANAPAVTTCSQKKS